MSRNKFRRSSPKRAPKRRLLIVCEGKETEYRYFDDIRKSLHISTMDIIVVHPGCTDPKGIVESAIDLKRSMIKEKRWTSDDYTWAVFDGDEHLESKPENWNTAIQKAESNKVHLAISNPSFELWFLLHFQDQRANIHRNEAKRKLCEHIKDYEKSMPVYDNHLKDLTENAITRAREIKRLASINGLAAYCNPYCGVWELVDILLKLRES